MTSETSPTTNSASSLAIEQPTLPPSIVKARQLLDAFDLALRSELENRTGEDDVAQTIALHELVSDLAGMVREWNQLSNDAMVNTINMHGDIEVGQTRHYIGRTKKTKANDQAAVMLALLDATGGDVDAINKCLSANAFKYATVRSYIPDEYDDLFTTTFVEDAKTGKPTTGLKSVNTNFTN